MQKLLFDYWDLKYGFFESWKEDKQFCESALKNLRRKHITFDIFLRPLRIKYFENRLKWLLEMQDEVLKLIR